MAVKSTGGPTLAESLADICVAARDDLDISRHVFFGETSYVVRDPVTFEGHNLSPSDYEILTSLRDDCALQAVFGQLVERELLEPSEEESFYQFVIELQKRNLLSLPVTDGDSLFQQFEMRAKARAKNPLMKLIALKIPLGSPDRFLKSSYHSVRYLFSPAFFCGWLLAGGMALFLIASHWQAFTSDLASALALQNLPAMVIVMSLLKLWHELGHGYACRHYKVSVPNAGVLFMLGTPLAFMDATGSWSLSKRTQRQIINMAGIYFEVMIAIVAVFVWVFAENASIKAIAHFTILISSVTTIAFNINPLLKYDGYFVLADLLGIPNLKTRSAFELQSLFKRIFLGHSMPASDSFSLRLILISYGFASGLFKLSLTLGIAILISTQVMAIGLLLGGYYLVATIAPKIINLVKYLLWSPETQGRRGLAWTYLAFLLGGVPMALLYCPVPGRAQARGIAEPETLHVVHIENGAFVKNMQVAEGQFVHRGAVLGRIENIEQSGQRQQKEARLNSLQVKYRRFRGNDLVQAAQTEAEINQLKYELLTSGTVKSQSTVAAPIDGWVIDSAAKSMGEYLAPGAEFVRLGDGDWCVRAVADANSLAAIKPQVGQRVHCRFVAHSGIRFSGTIENVSASGDRIVEHKALTHLAGGFIPVHPDSMEATEPFFELLIRLDDQPSTDFLKAGLVCEIRFDKDSFTVGEQLYRALLRFTNQINMS